VWATPFRHCHEIAAVRGDVDVAVQVCPEKLRAVLLQPGDRLRRGVPIRVAPARADDGHARVEGVDEGVRRSGSTAMVRDLEDVNRSAETGRYSLGEELWIDLLLDVARKQHPPLAEVQLEHD
jgi:hypothetical protein